MNKKISELDEANNINNEDLIMIVQNNQNKKIKASKLIKKQSNIVELEQIIQANTNYTIPLKYQVRKQLA